MAKLEVEIWSDIACPWCLVGKRRFEAALARFPDRASVQVTWRAFELDPSAPARQSSEISYAERLAKKYGMPVASAQERIDAMTKMGAADGIEFRFDRIEPGNTFAAHRLVHLGHDRGIQDAVKERFLLGYLSEGEAIGDRETVARLAIDAGLDADEVHAVLATDAHAADVRADERAAAELGISGVPFFVIGRYAVSGAQPTSVFLEALTRAWSEQAPVALGDASAEACGPDGCALPAAPHP